MTGPEINLERVSLVLGGVKILEDISFQVRAGNIHCLIGPNGGGKTSLIRSILGQMPHTGTIRIAWNKGNTTGYVPQQLDFDRTLPVTVSDFMALVCEKYRPVFSGMGKANRKLVEQALDRVGFKGKRNRKLGSLSGGERQRVLFAQALIPSPAILVLDEPMTSMDETGAEIFENLICELAEDGVTIVWIAHNLSLVNKVADQVTCIERKVLFTGSPSEVLAGRDAGLVFSSDGPVVHDQEGAVT